jgi:hypothetical protein
MIPTGDRLGVHTARARGDLPVCTDSYSTARARVPASSLCLGSWNRTHLQRHTRPSRSISSVDSHLRHLSSGREAGGTWQAAAKWSHGQDDRAVGVLRLPAQRAAEGSAQLTWRTRVYERIDAAVEVPQPEGEVEQTCDVARRASCVCKSENRITHFNCDWLTGPTITIRSAVSTPFPGPWVPRHFLRGWSERNVKLIICHETSVQFKNIWSHSSTSPIQ